MRSIAAGPLRQGNCQRCRAWVCYIQGGVLKNTLFGLSGTRFPCVSRGNLPDLAKMPCSTRMPFLGYTSGFYIARKC